jgi:BMFP domain-containing protein YqiC
MAKTPANEIFSTLKTYFNQLSDGERTPAEVATALNGWAKESAESVKAKIAEEVEATVSKMGFIKREEYDLLLERVSHLESAGSKKAKSKDGTKKKSVKDSSKVSKKPSAKVEVKSVKKRTTKKASM